MTPAEPHGLGFGAAAIMVRSVQGWRSMVPDRLGRTFSAVISPTPAVADLAGKPGRTVDVAVAGGRQRICRQVARLPSALSWLSAVGLREAPVGCRRKGPRRCAEEGQRCLSSTAASALDFSTRPPGFRVSPCHPTIRSGAQMNAPSVTLASISDLVSTFSRFQMPRRVCISVWQGTAKSVPCSPAGWASLAEVSPIIRAISREAMYSQALMPKPGSPCANRSPAALRSCELIDL